MKLKAAEFCAGIGGFREGIQNSILDVDWVYLNEIDLDCERTYKSNYFQSFDSKDIFDIFSDDLPDFDLMTAGFPCQPFSMAGKNAGFSDPRGQVIFKIIEIARKKSLNLYY